MSAGRVYEFAEFRLDAVERLLFRNGKRVPLTPKTVDGIFPYSAKRSRTAPKAGNSSRPSRSGGTGLSLPSPRWHCPESPFGKWAPLVCAPSDRHGLIKVWETLDFGDPYRCVTHRTATSFHGLNPTVQASGLNPL